MGRNPKPAADLKASGTYRADRHASRLENKVQGLSKAPAPPAHFDSKHKARWVEVCGNLVAFGIMHKADLSAVQQYVEVEIALFDVFSQLTKEGYTVVTETKAGVVTRANPLIRVYRDLDSTLKPLREQFGFTPRSRQSIHVSDDPAEKEKDPILSLLKKAV